MKRILIFFLVIGITAISSVSMAAMSNSRIRKETRFLTDKMAYELNDAQGNIMMYTKQLRFYLLHSLSDGRCDKGRRVGTR